MKSKMMIALLSFCLLGALPLMAAQGGGEIMITGSTTVLPVMQKAGEAFMAANPDIKLVISGGGSGNGIKALNEGLCQVAMSSRDIKGSEADQGKAAGVKPVRTAIAVDALLPVLHPDNPVRELSLEQLRGIYAGKIVNWKDVGGRDEKIVVISRDSSSGTFETWAEMIMKGDRVAPAALMQASNGGVVQTVANNRRAIGYIGFGYLNPSLKKIKVEGMEATAQNALSKAWPIARELYIFTNGEPAGAVKRLVDYLLDARKGQKAVAETGFIPLPAKAN
ncbi:MAG: phosphate ABC transporter substrate-binding protein [Deltaproteobacteria bacterium]|jgi:phosphate transport system substrate-binding protein|nr:phosphate ABC transporter substrate-binding protein [Deltaproteobacteria bacterium]